MEKCPITPRFLHWKMDCVLAENKSERNDIISETRNDKILMISRVQTSSLLCTKMEK